MYSHEEIERRLPVWNELANLFLDTDYLGIVGPKTVADRLRESGYGVDEVERTLFDDVLPAFAFNLRDLTGEWAGWHPDFLRKRMVEVQRWSPLRKRLARLGVARSIGRDWQKIRQYLD